MTLPWLTPFLFADGTVDLRVQPAQPEGRGFSRSGGAAVVSIVRTDSCLAGIPRLGAKVNLAIALVALAILAAAVGWLMRPALPTIAAVRLGGPTKGWRPLTLRITNPSAQAYSVFLNGRDLAIFVRVRRGAERWKDFGARNYMDDGFAYELGSLRWAGADSAAQFGRIRRRPSQEPVVSCRLTPMWCRARRRKLFGGFRYITRHASASSGSVSSFGSVTTI